MPWSEWIQNPDYNMTATLVNNEYSWIRSNREAFTSGAEIDTFLGITGESAGGGIQGSARAGSGTVTTTTNERADAWSPSIGLTAQHPAPLGGEPYASQLSVEFGQNLARFLVDPEWLAWRDTYPDVLFDLTEDVDFSVIPGRDPSADDAYVEYESAAPSSVTGWADWQIPWLHSGSYYLTGDGSITPSPDYPTRIAALVPPAALPEWPLYGVGTEIAMLSALNPLYVAGDDLNGHVVGSFWFTEHSQRTLSLTAVGTAHEWVMSVQPWRMSPDSGIVPGAVSIVDGQTDWSGGGVFDTGILPRPSYLMRMPRFRYWIPGDTYLRQNQRNDGLGRSVSHGRGSTSQQRSIRNRSYR